ncbi:MAG: hypothetical protein R2795_04885 [Saprospiraceae bacterium]
MDAYHTTPKWRPQPVNTFDKHNQAEGLPVNPPYGSYPFPKRLLARPTTDKVFYLNQYALEVSLQVKQDIFHEDVA